MHHYRRSENSLFICIIMRSENSLFIHHVSVKEFLIHMHHHVGYEMSLFICITMCLTTWDSKNCLFICIIKWGLRILYLYASSCEIWDFFFHMHHYVRSDNYLFICIITWDLIIIYSYASQSGTLRILNSYALPCEIWKYSIYMHHHLRSESSLYSNAHVPSCDIQEVFIHMSHQMRSEIFICVIMWALRVPFCVNALPQTLHLYGFSPVCIR